MNSCDGGVGSYVDVASESDTNAIIEFAVCFSDDKLENDDELFAQNSEATSMPGKVEWKSWCCCNLSVGVGLDVRFTRNRMYAKNNTHIHVARTSNNSDFGMWSLLLLAAKVWNFAHLPFGLSDRNKTVLWPGREGRARCRLHTKKVRSVRFAVKRCCCNLSVGIALYVRFTTNRMCAKNNTHIYMWREQVIIEWSWHVISIVACCRSVKLSALAARAFRSQQCYRQVLCDTVGWLCFNFDDVPLACYWKCSFHWIIQILVGTRAVTDLGIDHGLGLRATHSCDDSRRICETAQRHNCTTYVETSENTNV